MSQAGNNPNPPKKFDPQGFRAYRPTTPFLERIHSAPMPSKDVERGTAAGAHRPANVHPAWLAGTPIVDGKLRGVGRNDPGFPGRTTARFKGRNN